MGERYYAELSIGPIPPAAWGDVRAAIGDDMSEEEVRRLPDGSRLILVSDDLAKYGLCQLEDLRGRLVELGIPYSGSDREVRERRPERLVGARDG